MKHIRQYFVYQSPTTLDLPERSKVVGIGHNFDNVLIFVEEDDFGMNFRQPRTFQAFRVEQNIPSLAKFVGMSHIPNGGSLFIYQL